MKIRVLGRSLQFDEDSDAVAGIDLGNGLAGLLVIVATANKAGFTAQGPGAGDQQFSAANTSPEGRKALIVANNGSTNLHVVTAASAVAGTMATETVVPPGQSWDAPENYQGPVSGWWEGAPTGSASVTEIV